MFFLRRDECVIALEPIMEIGTAAVGELVDTASAR
jgi:hypothetical protein